MRADRYCSGLAAKCGAAPGSTADAHRAAAASSGSLGARLQALVRALPRPATGRQLVEFMNGALELTASAGLRLPQPGEAADEGRARAALSDAVNSPASIGIASMSEHYGPETPAYRRTVELGTRAVAASSASAGRTAVRAGAARDLARELRHPSVPNLPGGMLGTMLLALASGYAASRILAR